jgi:hypothetical protein
MNFKLKQNWLNFVDLYSKSGMTKADFCRSQKIPAHTFFYYQKFHGTIKNSFPRSEQSVAPLFVPLTEKKEFRIRINNSVSLSFDSVPEASWMASFVKSLGETHART